MDHKAEASRPIHQYLTKDHDRLGDLLGRAIAGVDGMDGEAYRTFRAGLLRHIGLEEKLLFPLVKRTDDSNAAAMVSRLHQEHALFSAMLVPTPTIDIVTQLRDLLADHNVREESADGVYALAERTSGRDAERLAAELRASPDVRVAPHYDTELAREN